MLLWRSQPCPGWGERTVKARVGNNDLSLYWAKTDDYDEDVRGRSHLLPHHLLDVAATLDAYLESHPDLLHRLSKMLGLSARATRAWLRFLASLHDLGKVSPRFQLAAPDACRAHPFEGWAPGGHRHDALGLLLWDARLAEHVAAWFAPENKVRVTTRLARWGGVTFGHHGYPADPMLGGRWSPPVVTDHFRERDIEAAASFVEQACGLLVGNELREEIREWLSIPSTVSESVATWIVAGTLVQADWIGSLSEHFGYVDEAIDPPTYWTKNARPAARNALRATRFDHEPDLKLLALPDLLPAGKAPRPLQTLVAEVDLPSEPALYILEDATGSGKTEAALHLALRLAARGDARGVYFALPTIATADALYPRVSSKLDQAVRPGGQSLQRLRAHSRAKTRQGDPSTGEPTTVAACTAWLAERPKAALLADAAVGTLDQALLAVLPVRHQSLRIAGLKDKVLIIDEVHAYDPYMAELTQTLIAHQLRAGRSVVVLTATLPSGLRARLLTNALSVLGREDEPAVPVGRGVTIASSRGVQGHPIDEPPTSRRIRVRHIASEEEALAVLEAARARGATAAWVRNTVDEVLVAAEKARTRGLEPLVLHGRFTIDDRDRLERELMGRLGPDAGPGRRRGTVLIATQVVEQSLDIDVDEMVTDLAPVEFIIQRAGRLHRHARDPTGKRTQEGRDEREPPVLHIHAPGWSEEPPVDWVSSWSPGSAAVYLDHANLWLTMQRLSDTGEWESPTEDPALLEHVYGPDVLARIPPGLLESHLKASGKDSAWRSTASALRLKLDKPYGDALGSWESEEEVTTRLSEPSLTLRLGLVEDGRVRPLVREGRSWPEADIRVAAKRFAGLSPSKDLLGEISNWEVERPRDWVTWMRMIPFTSVDAATYEATLEDEKGVAYRCTYSHDYGLTLPERTT